MCPICWTLAVLTFLGFGSATVTLFVQSNGWLSLSLMVFTSIVFWMLTYKLVMNKCEKGGKECKCPTKN